jgi:hypothetical protein
VIAWISVALLGFVALTSWRLSRAISLASWFAFAANCLYVALLQHYPEAWARGSLEWMRLVSLVVGSAGVYELATRTRERAKTNASLDLVSVGKAAPTTTWIATIEARARRWGFGRVDVIALLCIASAAVDGVAWLGFPYGLAWSQPWIQSAVCVAIVGLCEWPRKEGAA